MSKAIDEMLNSILEEFAACKQAREELESKGAVSAVELLPTTLGKRTAAGKACRPQVSC